MRLGVSHRNDMERINDTFTPSQAPTNRNAPPPVMAGSRNAWGKYHGEEIVHYGIVAFMLLTGLWLARETATDTISFIGQCFGFTVTTWLIITIYKGLKSGKYIGPQRGFARAAYQLLLVDEGLTILAKYYEPLRPYYLMWIAVSIPVLAYTAFHLIMLDEDMELETTKKENRLREKVQRELRATTTKLLEIDKEISVVQAARRVHDANAAALLAEATNRATRADAAASARNTMGEVYRIAGLKHGDGVRKRIGVGKMARIRKRLSWGGASSDGAGVKPERLEVVPTLAPASTGDGAASFR